MARNARVMRGRDEERGRPVRAAVPVRSSCGQAWAVLPAWLRPVDSVIATEGSGGSAFSRRSVNSLVSAAGSGDSALLPRPVNGLLRDRGQSPQSDHGERGGGQGAKTLSACSAPVTKAQVSAGFEGRPLEAMPNVSGPGEAR